MIFTLVPSALMGTVIAGSIIGLTGLWLLHAWRQTKNRTVGDFAWSQILKSVALLGSVPFIYLSRDPYLISVGALILLIFMYASVTFYARILFGFLFPSDRDRLTLVVAGVMVLLALIEFANFTPVSILAEGKVAISKYATGIYGGGGVV